MAQRTIELSGKAGRTPLKSIHLRFLSALAYSAVKFCMMKEYERRAFERVCFFLS
jgi:hypothetical protein